MQATQFIKSVMKLGKYLPIIFTFIYVELRFPDSAIMRGCPLLVTAECASLRWKAPLNL